MLTPVGQVHHERGNSPPPCTLLPGLCCAVPGAFGAPIQRVVREGLRLLQTPARNARAGERSQARDAPPERLEDRGAARLRETVRGFSGTSLLIVDEAARVDDELYYAVRPMLAVSGGSLMMLTTPYGKRGAFHEEWTGGREWDRYEVPAKDCPRITPEFLEEEREALPSYIYRQEYECSFEDTEDQIFTHEMVQAAVTSDVKSLFGGG